MNHGQLLVCKSVLFTHTSFLYNDNVIEVVKSYKYLGLVMDEFLTFDEGVNTLNEAVGRALGAMISKVNFVKNISYNCYTKLLVVVSSQSLNMVQKHGVLRILKTVTLFKTELLDIF